MSKIKIKNFGPIKEGYQDDDGWIDVKKVTVFIGNQGSGKSTVAKVISTMTWLEKALTRGDYDVKSFSKSNVLKNQFLNYHRLKNYFNEHVLFEKTEFEYKGDAYHINFDNGKVTIHEVKSEGYSLPQIMYIPAERNFVANVKNPKALNLTSDAMIEFVSEYGKALEGMKGTIHLPINDVEIEYNKHSTIVYIKGKDYRIKLSEASSGFQSFVPLFLVSQYLSNSVKSKSGSAQDNMTSEEIDRFKNGVATIWGDTTLTYEQRRAALSVLSSKFNKSAFINIVEEPEQNLFPTSQWEMLKSLLKFNNANEDNKLIMTTHSPYLINYLTLAVKADTLKENINVDLKKLHEIVPIDSMVDPDDLVIYELDEKNGTIKKLGHYHGIPSDENKLNEGLGESNELFAQLLEIQQGL